MLSKNVHSKSPEKVWNSNDELATFSPFQSLFIEENVITLHYTTCTHTHNPYGNGMEWKLDSKVRHMPLLQGLDSPVVRLFSQQPRLRTSQQPFFPASFLPLSVKHAAGDAEQSES